MNFKVIAVGNILMKDDGIGIETAKIIEDKLIKKNIEVIYGETDAEYCISQIREDDYIFIIDAACFGKTPGKITSLPISAIKFMRKARTGHDYSFLNLLKIYYPNINGEIYGIEVNKVEFGIGLSSILEKNLKNISIEILNKIDKGIEIMRGE